MYLNINILSRLVGIKSAYAITEKFAALLEEPSATPATPKLPTGPVIPSAPIPSRDGDTIRKATTIPIPEPVRTPISPSARHRWQTIRAGDIEQPTTEEIDRRIQEMENKYYHNPYMDNIGGEPSIYDKIIKPLKAPPSGPYVPDTTARRAADLIAPIDLPAPPNFLPSTGVRDPFANVPVSNLLAPKEPYEVPILSKLLRGEKPW